MKKVELLAPAGNYESFIAAINAGADAVYLAGNRFGARAYADNFTEEEVCQAIRYAHLFHKKVYLTVNILLKEEELSDLYAYMDPFYQCGLDGVIVQDLGAFVTMQHHFPELELHASTQMTLTGVNGAKLLSQMGATRIVPARELSLEEIRDIKKNVNIEIEAFVHGAECYSYSGACLLSSIIGGRSG
ncbi:MAG: U32 family peptidase, partial [Lachnospiraceae bacterium]|nr:U32 family peptidase [Lachnospiraceae bacterium]